MFPTAQEIRDSMLMPRLESKMAKIQKKIFQAKNDGYMWTFIKSGDMPEGGKNFLEEHGYQVNYIDKYLDQEPYFEVSWRVKE
jgi:hypothetical protein